MHRLAQCERSVRTGYAAPRLPQRSAPHKSRAQNKSSGLPEPGILSNKEEKLFGELWSRTARSPVVPTNAAVDMSTTKHLSAARTPRAQRRKGSRGFSRHARDSRERVHDEPTRRESRHDERYKKSSRVSAWRYAAAVFRRRLTIRNSKRIPVGAVIRRAIGCGD